MSGKHVIRQKTVTSKINKLVCVPSKESNTFSGLLVFSFPFSFPSLCVDLCDNHDDEISDQRTRAVFIDDVEWTGVKFVSVSPAWGTQVKYFPIACFQCPAETTTK